MKKIKKNNIFKSFKQDKNRKEKNYPKFDPREKNTRGALFDYFNGFFRRNEEE